MRDRTVCLLRRLAAVATSLALVAVGLIVLAASPAAALGPGQVCVFLEPDGAPVLGDNRGHVGWGFLIAGSDQWIYGSTENPNGAYQVWAPGFNGAWMTQGTYAQMLDDFTHQWDYPSSARYPGKSNRLYPGHPYTTFKCENTATSGVTAAKKAATDNISAGYTGLGNNCLDAVYRVLNAYGAPNLPSPSSNWAPKAWFNGLNSSTWWTGKLGEVFIDENSRQYLDVEGVSTADGARVHQWTWTGADNQWWLRVYDNNGYYRLFSRNSGKCLGVTGASTAEGAQVVQWSCNDSADQEWAFRSTGRTIAGWPVYQIVNRNSGRCLGVQGGSTAVGALAVQWSCNGNPDQNWF